LAGYADQMVLSHDSICYTHWPLEENYGPLPSPNLISDTVLPALRERGVEGAQIDQMLVTNPRRIFEQQGSY
jgi:phosphotriesterase-related protein